GAAQRDPAAEEFRVLAPPGHDCRAARGPRAPAQPLPAGRCGGDPPGGARPEGAGDSLPGLVSNTRGQSRHKEDSRWGAPGRAEPPTPGQGLALAAGRLGRVPGTSWRMKALVQSKLNINCLNLTMQKLEDETHPPLKDWLNQSQKYNLNTQQDNCNYKEHSKQNEVCKVRNDLTYSLNKQNEVCKVRNDLTYSLNKQNEVGEVRNTLTYSLNEDVSKDDLFKEKKAEDRHLNQLLSKLEQLSKNSQVVLGFKMKSEKLFYTYKELRLMLEKVIIWNHQGSLDKSTAMEIIQMKTGQWKAELSEIEKGLWEVMKMSEQTVKELSGKCNSDSFPVWQEQKELIRMNQEKDLEIAKLKKNIERIEIEHKTTKEILSSHLEEWKQMAPLLKEKEFFMNKGISKPKEELEHSETSRKNEEDIIKVTNTSTTSVAAEEAPRERSGPGEKPRYSDTSQATGTSTTSVAAEEAPRERSGPGEKPRYSDTSRQNQTLQHTIEATDSSTNSIMEENSLNELGQLVTGQLCFPKDLLLGKHDLLLTQPSTESPLTAEPEDLNSSPSASSKLLQEEVEVLRKSIQEKDATVQKLQEELQKLSDSITTTSELEREQHKQNNSQIKRLKEKHKALQNLLEEKDLLIKAKNNDLLSLRENLSSQVNENEIYKQAVINLKERVSNFETESGKQKQENEKLKASSKEKEGEVQALQDTNVKLSQLLRELESQYLPVKKVLEQLMKEDEKGKTGDLNQLLNKITLMQEKILLLQKEKDEVIIVLKNKQLEIDALQSEVQSLSKKESQLNQELVRCQKQTGESQYSSISQGQDADEREANLRMKIVQLEEKLHSSFTATEDANQQAKILQDQLNVTSKLKDEIAAQLSTCQEQEKQCTRALTDLKVVLAESMEKTEHLKGKAASLQGHLDQANADLQLKEGQVEELKKQNEVIKEMLDEVQKKWMDLIIRSDKKVDKSLMRKLFLDYFRTQKDERQEVLQQIGSTLGLQKEEMDSLLQGDPGGINRTTTGQFGSQNVPNTPQKPNESSTQKNSFSQLFVQFMQSETHESLAAPNSSAHCKTPDSAGKKKIMKKEPPTFKQTLNSTPPKMRASTVVSLVSPPGYEAGGSGNLLYNVANAFPTYTHLLLSPSKKAGVAQKDSTKL
ncbi:Thyroid receptor-interacting protein 11, partial [Galemys pyrenaicus]